TKAELDLDQLRAEFEEGWARVEDKKEHGEAWARAAVVREGTEGLSVEVVDLRTVNPLDEDTMTASVAKTGRAVVVAEPQGFASVASELVARIQQRCFHSLAAPVGRVTGFDIPFPAPKLEEHHLPNIDRILDAIDDLNWDLDAEEARA
ncbi:alpha-ketoacid dehydrogenase subunit beta, partial [Thiopseudomonas sp. 4R-3cl]